jgi:NADPH:quinone reductase-like Zn-dependent oxidoreductase
MKAVHVHRRAHRPAIAVGDAPTPQPAEGEVLVAVHAAAVTPTELEWAPTWTRRTGEPRPLPIIPGHELSGEICALGPGVTGLAEGEAVFGMNDWFRDGAQAEYCVAPAASVAPKPHSVDHVGAAVMPISALTAWQGLFERAHLEAGQRVLIHGAAGGVGVCAVQLARWRGAHVIGTASASNRDFVRGLGADEVIDYRAERFEDIVRDVDVVFDGVGGGTLARSWSVLRPAGKMITVAASEEQARDQRVRDAFFIVEANRSQLEEVARLIDGGVLRPVVGAIFPLAGAEQAYAHKPPHGKVVLRIVP